MPIGQPAFLPFENVKIVDEEKLQFIYEQSTTPSPLSIHTIFDPMMHLHAGRESRIVGVGCYHTDIPVYNIEGSQFAWPEQAFLDPYLRDDCPANNPRSRANKTYVATLMDGRLAITNQAGECFCRLRKRYPEAAVDAANIVANLRHRHAFETLYGFDGRYDGEPS